MTSKEAISLAKLGLPEINKAGSLPTKVTVTEPCLWSDDGRKVWEIYFTKRFDKWDYLCREETFKLKGFECSISKRYDSWYSTWFKGKDNMLYCLLHCLSESYAVTMLKQELDKHLQRLKDKEV